MKERPILFNGDMVRAILAGRKTQTRRVVKPQPAGRWSFESSPVLGEILPPHPKANRFGVFALAGAGSDFQEVDLYPCPYGRPGDHLWVRETWDRSKTEIWINGRSSVVYRATNDPGTGLSPFASKWRPSIHMPRWASRITLVVGNVRVERVQDISEDDAHAEGVTHAVHGGHLAREGFQNLWDSINSRRGYGWDVNPWVWVVEFAKLA